MNNADLARIESELDIELPGYYRSFMLNYPPNLLAIDDGPSRFEFSNSADHLIDWNRMIQMYCEDWPAEYFLIGESGCGDYYAIDLDDPHSPVYFYDHDYGNFENDEGADSLEEFAGRLIQMYQRITEHQRALARAEQGIFGRLIDWWRNRGG